MRVRVCVTVKAHAHGLSPRACAQQDTPPRARGAIFGISRTLVVCSCTQVDLAMSQVAASGEMEQQQLAAYEHDASESSERRLREHFESTVSAIRYVPVSGFQS